MMNEPVQVRFIFNNNEYKVLIQSEDYNNFPLETVRILGRNLPIHIPESISDDVFQSLISYFENHLQPNITFDKIAEYAILNNIMKIPIFTELIQSINDLYENGLRYIEILNDNSILDKSEIENMISQNLDYYFDNYSEQLMNTSTQSLYNILYKNKDILNQNKIYEFIQNYYQRNNDSNVFVLLKLINGNLLDEHYLNDSIKMQNLHFGCIPEFNILDMLNKIQDLEKEIKEYKNYLSMIPPNSIQINQDDLICALNPLNLTASVTLPNKEEIRIPRSINFNSKTFVITNINRCNLTNVKSIIIAEDSAIHTLNLNNIISNKKYQISIPPSVEKIIFNHISDCICLVSENNHNFAMTKTKLLFGKSKPDVDAFDTLLKSQGNIESVTIKSNVKFIKHFCFYNCTNLKTINFFRNSMLKTIEESCFENSSIERIVFPSSIIKIKSKAFCNCHKLRNVSFPNNSKLEYIGEYSFSSSSIKSISIPANVTTIDSGAFRNCSFLTQIIFSSNSRLQKIGYSSFESSAIESIIIPSRVREIESGAFKNCQKLSDIKFTENSEIQTIGQYAFSRTAIKSIEIPKTIAIINEGLFESCSFLQNVSFSNESNLHTIGSKAFYRTGIKTISIPPHVKQIGEGAFCECMQLNSLTIPDDSDIEYIGDILTSSPSNKSFSIPSNVYYINNAWFCFNKHMINIIVSPNNKNFKWFNNSLLMRKSNPQADTFDVLIYAKRNIDHILIPSCVKYIDDFSFNHCSKLKTIEFESNSKLISIGDCAFRYSSITSIKIPQNVQTIGTSAFGSCSQLKNVTFSNDCAIRSIGSLAFYFTAIESITIPSKIKTLSPDIFYNCSKLTEVEFGSDSQLETIGKGSFSGSSITNIRIPPLVTTIERCAFKDCKKLHRIEFPENSKLKSIEEEAFRCSSITDINIPPFASVDITAFEGCDKFHKLYN